MLKIALDAGHGLHSPGKEVPQYMGYGQVKEWTLNNRIVTALQDMLKGNCTLFFYCHIISVRYEKVINSRLEDLQHGVYSKRSCELNNKKVNVDSY